ncbi:hypothetical protein AX14_002318 [Amanita brunnescens Koide BX004]|nr:hypothetical protein AX14_002318 [Amanita brunnescens Koide BX004]
MFPNENLKIRISRHYQLALEDIDGDLRNFSCVKGFVKAIRDATIAHDDALCEAEVLHRDISIRNIVILEDGTGLLVWDLCKVMNSAPANEGHAIEPTPRTLTSELQRIFDRSENGGAEGGQAKQDALQSGGTNEEANFQNFPLANLLETVRKLVTVQYPDESDDEAEPLMPEAW